MDEKTRHKPEASGAAQGARRDSQRAPLGEQPPEDLRVGVYVCNCGSNIAGFLDTKSIADYARTLPNVVFVRENLFSCSEAGINDIRKGIAENKLNRVVVAACTPRTHEPTFRAACAEAGLNPYYFEFVNIREHCSWVHKQEREVATAKAKDLIRMGVARAAYLEPMEPIVGDVTRLAVVIGGGVSGMTVALTLAGRGFDIVLVEQGRQLGGLVRDLEEIYPWRIKAKTYAAGLAAKVERHPRIKVLKSSEVTDVRGFVGKYQVSISSLAEPVEAGVIVLATGARPLVPEGLYSYDGKRVITQAELERRLAKPKVAGRNVVMIECVGARNRERIYCSRICCMTSLKNAILLKRKRVSQVTVLYRDLMCYGLANEALLREAKQAGVRFIKYAPEKPPEADGGKITVACDTLGQDVVVSYDLLVLSTPLVPAATNEALSRILKVPLDEDGFFLEAHIKLRPLDFATDGIFVCGTARWPATVEECVEQALGAASRASTFLVAGRVKVEPAVSWVSVDDCRGCGLCVALCPYGAIELVDTEHGKRAHTVEVACKGCGVCGATCYRHAIKMKHFSDQQVTAQIRAAFAKE
ncbi:MAG TPA: CoB--CoM heterodisulfide reductase iron-sulfur subunit A family protein [bacterium]|nr:CoB--CoM heterodisulfide reductase iron-sulfur subunit A family protein [bacterium]